MRPKMRRTLRPLELERLREALIAESENWQRRAPEPEPVAEPAKPQFVYVVQAWKDGGAGDKREVTVVAGDWSEAERKAKSALSDPGYHRWIFFSKSITETMCYTGSA